MLARLATCGGRRLCARSQPVALRVLSARAASSSSKTVDSMKIARWSARLSHDNTFLSYHRNAIIATVAGCALIQYRKGEGRPPLAGAGLLTMGGLCATALIIHSAHCP